VTFRWHRQILDWQLVERHRDTHLRRYGLHHLIVGDKPMPGEIPSSGSIRLMT
jgi:hypothetical protein